MATNGKPDRTLLVKVTSATLAKVHAMAAAKNQTMAQCMTELIDYEFDNRIEELERLSNELETQVLDLNSALKGAGI